MTRDQIDIALDRAITEIDAEARDRGHIPHPWARDEIYAAHTACRLCGADAAVRVRAGRDDAVQVWRAGHLLREACS